VYMYVCVACTSCSDRHRPLLRRGDGLVHSTHKDEKPRTGGVSCVGSTMDARINLQTTADLTKTRECGELGLRRSGVCAESP